MQMSIRDCRGEASGTPRAFAAGFFMTAVFFLLCPSPSTAQTTAKVGAAAVAGSPQAPAAAGETPPSGAETAASASASAGSGGLANIGYLNAKALSDRCSRSEASSSSYCFAYLAAVTDTARAYEIWLGSREFCLPTGIAQADIRRAFMTYVNAYPAQSSGQAASVIVNALKQTYPCE